MIIAAKKGFSSSNQAQAHVDKNLDKNKYKAAH